MSTATDLTVPNTLPPDIVVLSSGLVAQVESLTTQANAITVTDPATLEQAESLFETIRQLNKRIRDDRLELTRPLDALKKQVMDVEKQATGPLEDAQKRLGNAAHAYRQEIKRQAEEAERKRREEEARLRREADERRRQAEEEARRKAEEEAALFGTPVEPELVNIPDPEPVKPEPVHVPAPLPSKSKIKTKKTEVLVIEDEGALLAAACKEGGKIAGVPVLSIDEKAIKKLMAAGVTVPGCRIDVREGWQASGR